MNQEELQEVQSLAVVYTAHGKRLRAAIKAHDISEINRMDRLRDGIEREAFRMRQTLAFKKAVSDLQHPYQSEEKRAVKAKAKADDAAA